MMPLGMWVAVGWMLFVLVIVALLIVWGKKTGQFDDIEEPKYRMLEEREPAPWPGREEKNR